MNLATDLSAQTVNNFIHSFRGGLIHADEELIFFFVLAWWTGLNVGQVNASLLQSTDTMFMYKYFIISHQLKLFNVLYYNIWISLLSFACFAYFRRFIYSCFMMTLWSFLINIFICVCFYVYIYIYIYIYILKYIYSNDHESEYIYIYIYIYIVKPKIIQTLWPDHVLLKCYLT